MKEEKPANFKTTVFELLELIVLCTITVVLIVTFCARLTFVQQHSMDKTLTENDLLLVSNLFYKPQRGDIVVSQNSSLSAHPDPLIKRVIAVGGDELTINFKTWQVTINSGSEPFTL